eukprot:Gb_36539 [translate_table: standard]
MKAVRPSFTPPLLPRALIYCGGQAERGASGGKVSRRACEKQIPSRPYPYSQDCMDPSIFLAPLALALLLFNIRESVSDEVDQLAKGATWIVAGRFNPNHIAPLCSHSCINAFGNPDNALPNRTVGLYRCNVTYCIDNFNKTMPFAGNVNDGSTYPLRLRNCIGKRSQQWFLQEDGKIRSAIRSENNEVLYLQANKIKDTWGRSALYLGHGDDKANNTYVSFTFIPIPTNGTLLSNMMATIPSPGSSANLVSNGGFENTGSLSTANNNTPSFMLGHGEPDLCYWSVGNEAYIVSGSGSESWEAEEGVNSLVVGGEYLEGYATLTQFIRTAPGDSYLLSFYMAGYPNCGYRNKTIWVQISTSSNSSKFIVKTPFTFDSEGKSFEDIGWQLVSLDFKAESEVTNLTFVNRMNAKMCAPIIDNVTVVRGLRAPPIKRSKGNKKRLATIVSIPIAVVITLIGLTILILLLRTKRVAMMESLNKFRKKKSASEAFALMWKRNGEPVNRGQVMGGIRTYTVEELAKATDGFQTKVGEGGFGAVYRADLGGNQIGAVKRATRMGLRDLHASQEELSMLLRLRHPNLVNLIGLCFERGEQILVFEFISNGSLYDRLHIKKGGAARPLSWSNRMNIAAQVAVALYYLHEETKPAVVHRDVKSANVLLMDDNRAKLGDFGLSRFGPKDHNRATSTSVKGSYGYTDPEYIKTGRLSVKSDVYSFGVLLLELITGLKSVQGMQTLPEWTQEYRLSEDVETVMAMVDPNLQGHIDLQQEVQNIVRIANNCVLEKGELRPSMREIVSGMSIEITIPHPSNVQHEENTDADANESESGGVVGSGSMSILYNGR